MKAYIKVTFNLGQTYVFNGGIKGLRTMAADAVRLKLDIEGIAGLADKVMRPEGAVETAALLTTMGGEFAKLGDPFQLMFKARNDFAIQCREPPRFDLLRLQFGACRNHPRFLVVQD